MTLTPILDIANNLKQSNGLDYQTLELPNIFVRPIDNETYNQIDFSPTRIVYTNPRGHLFIQEVVGVHKATNKKVVLEYYYRTESTEGSFSINTQNAQQKIVEVIQDFMKS